MVLVEIKNHADLAVGLLLEQLKDKEKLEAFLRALVGPIQDMEEVAHDLDTEMRLNNAIGAQLDIIGRIIKLTRGPLGDEAYRTRIRARIRANRSEGTPDDVLAVLRLMVAVNALSIEEYPTGMVARVADALAEDPDALVAELRRARPGAVPLHLEYTLAADADTFAFADGDSEEADADAGWSGMRWIAVGDDAGIQTYIATSDDASAWTQRNNPKDEDLNGIAYDGKGVLIAVGDNDGTDAYMLRSTDEGESWSEISLPGMAYNLNAICYSLDLDLWIAVGNSADTSALLLTSDDSGLTWTARSNPDNVNLHCVCWCPSIDLFVAGGDPSSGDVYLITSPDGINWTERASSKNSLMRGICWSEDLSLAVAVGDNFGTAGIVTSPDGINWTKRNHPKNLGLYGVCWHEGLSLFVAVGSPDTDSYIVTSPDGIHWTERTAPTAVTLFEVAAHGASELAAVGDTGGGDALILTSGDGIAWTEQSNPANYGLYGITGAQRMSLGGAWSYAKEA